ncbi:unnamed protein product [Porites evermanni]|uniref:Uncharacterized protein n=1 Tax=Porites evermanni TaxID=104178 RepID=A0ABN8QJM9_9CNID|nr:unnamed protein product [Porites evermanni]
MGAMTVGLFSKTHIASSLFSPTKTGSTLVVGTVRISTLAKPNGDCMTEILNISRQSSAHQKSTFPHFQSSQRKNNVTSTGHNLKWDHFDLLPGGKLGTHCKIKETSSSY